ncbi:MAG: hypothetical protein RL095_1896 [Verrucomicrobiota bacterium]|jgi:putative addiction module component (TIGR02574 family)
MTTLELLKEAQDLPIEERALLADCLLRSLQPGDPELSAQWLAEIRRRAQALEEGRASTISLEDWRQKVRRRFPR